MEFVLWFFLILCLVFIACAFIVLGMGLWQTYQYNKFEVEFIEKLANGENVRKGK